MPSASEADELVLQIGDTLGLQQSLCESVETISECGHTIKHTELRTYAPLFPT